jgi:siroheme decarboxylase
MGYEMDNMDKAIVASLQDDFPLVANPYDVVADRLGIDIEEFWKRLDRLIDNGVIRRLGASINSHKFGFKSTLAAISVEPDVIAQAAMIMERYPEITHCYLRKHKFNIWFTVIAINEERIKNILEMIRLDLSLDEAKVLNLPMKRMFKLDARFNIAP